MSRHYYKSTDGKSLLNLKTLYKEEGFTEITEEEFNQLEQERLSKQPDIKIKEKQQRIAELKSLLASTDYQAIKFAEGALSAEEYADMKAQRQAWRDEINSLEAE